MLLDELASFLQTAGLGVVGTSIFKGSIPLDASGSADALVALIELPGMHPMRAHDLTRYEQPVVQIATRGAPHGYAAARQQAQTVWLALDGVTNAMLSSVVYLWIQALQSPFYLKVDEYHRPLIVFNVRCARAL